MLVFVAIFGLVANIFAAPKVERFIFDFSKDFYPGMSYVYFNGSTFKESYLSKADVLKNEFIFEKVTTYCALVPIYLTLKVTLQKDGGLSYEYSNLKYKKDGTKLEMTLLVDVNLITKQFDTLLPKVFNDEEKYSAAKSKFYNEPGILYAMADGLTEIRAKKFSELVKGNKINIKASLSKADMNDNKNYADYQYYLIGYVKVGLLSSISFIYYTNDDDKASAAENEIIDFTGIIKDFGKLPYIDNLSFTICDE